MSQSWNVVLIERDIDMPNPYGWDKGIGLVAKGPENRLLLHTVARTCDGGDGYDVVEAPTLIVMQGDEHWEIRYNRDDAGSWEVYSVTYADFSGPKPLTRHSDPEEYLAFQAAAEPLVEMLKSFWDSAQMPPFGYEGECWTTIRETERGFTVPWQKTTAEFSLSDDIYSLPMAQSIFTSGSRWLTGLVKTTKRGLDELRCMRGCMPMPVRKEISQSEAVGALERMSSELDRLIEFVDGVLGKAGGKRHRAA